MRASPLLSLLLVLGVSCGAHAKALVTALQGHRASAGMGGGSSLFVSHLGAGSLAEPPAIFIGSTPCDVQYHTSTAERLHCITRSVNWADAQAMPYWLVGIDSDMGRGVVFPIYVITPDGELAECRVQVRSGHQGLRYRLLLTPTFFTLVACLPCLSLQGGCNFRIDLWNTPNISLVLTPSVVRGSLLRFGGSNLNVGQSGDPIVLTRGDGVDRLACRTRDKEMTAITWRYSAARTRIWTYSLVKGTRLIILTQLLPSAPLFVARLLSLAAKSTRISQASLLESGT